MMAGSSLLGATSLWAGTTGEVTLPYEQRFNTASDVDGFTIVDANGDGHKWQWRSGAMIYEFNDTLDADDWLITPQFNVDTRHVYRLAFKAVADEQGIERLGVSLGTQPEPGAMTTQLMAPATIDATSPRNRTLTFRPAESGPLCVGFHALSSCLLGYQLTLDNIAIYQLTSVDAPDTVTHLRAVADPQGGRQATVSFKLPTTTIAGDALTGKLQAAIVCWGDTLTRFNNCDPGQELSYVHNSDATGMHVYTVVVAGNGGKGLDASVSTYIGEDSPAAVTSLKLTQLSAGKLQLSWTSPERGTHGGWVAPGSVSYVVTDLQGKPDTVAASPYEYTFTPSQRQQLQAFTVQAFNAKGKSAVAVSDTLFVGDAYGMPFVESFARTRIASSPWILQENAHAGWIVNDHGVYAEPVDRDGGLLSFSHAMEGSQATVIMPKVAVTGKHPRLKFWFWNDKRLNNELSVVVKDAKGNEHFLDRLAEHNAQAEKGRWTVHSYALDDFAAASPVQVKFNATGHLGESPVMVLYLDKVSITDVPERDLALDSFAVARTALRVGETDTFTVAVTNLGLYATSDYTLRLYRNGKEVARCTGPQLQPDESVKLTITDRPNSDADESSLYWLRIDSEGDAVAANDSTGRVAVTVLPGLPYVAQVKATPTAAGAVDISWQQPLINNQPAGWVTEGFESYPAFSITNMGEWTLIDQDGRPTMGVRDASGDFLDYPNAGKPMAFQVFNPAATGLTASTWAPHGGSQVAAAFTCGSYAKNDDWLISPRVDGSQTITFWAKSPGNTDFGTTEQVEVYYSTTTTEVSAFKKTGSTLAVPGSWKQFSAQLPEGTRYFALRCVSADQYILFIDDVYYRQAERKLTLQGYNVYRNGTLLTPAPVTATQYTDPALDEGHYVYQVTAVYDAGESTPSPEAVVDVASGVVDVAASGARPVAYYNLAGQRVDASATGILLVRFTDGTVRKILNLKK